MMFCVRGYIFCEFIAAYRETRVRLPRLWGPAVLQNFDLQDSLVPHLEDLINICLKPACQSPGWILRMVFATSKKTLIHIIVWWMFLEFLSWLYASTVLSLLFFKILIWFPLNMLTYFDRKYISHNTFLFREALPSFAFLYITCFGLKCWSKHNIQQWNYIKWTKS